MTDPTITEALKEIGLMEDLDVRYQKHLAGIAGIVCHQPGEVIFREGQRQPFVYWIVDGQVSLEMSTGGTIPQLLMTLGRGDLLAWSAMLGGGRMQASAKADQTSQLLQFNVTELKELCQSNHEIGYRVVEHLARRLADRLLATRLQLLDLFKTPGGHSK